MKIFLDIEASGLHPTSYPVEVAWVAADLSRGWSTLIEPSRDWSDYDWDMASERVHGLNQDQLYAAGVAVEDVADRLNADLADADVLTDNPRADFQWLRRLYDAAGREPTFAMMSPPAVGAKWTSTVADWHGRKVQLDVDCFVAQVANQARIAPDVHEAFAAALSAEVGIVSHRALDDAVEHALALAAVELLTITRDSGDAAARTARTDLVDRARQILIQHGRR